MTPPIVIAHRGACGYLPEHTLAAYALAIGQGADFIEPDLVATRDGVLVARHDNELSASTDVAGRGEFADRRCRKIVEGGEVDGWFVEDFTLAEIRRLRARERLPALRPQSASHDGRYGVPTLAEIVALVQSAPRPVGLYPEIKSPTWFAHEGRRLDGSLIAQRPGEMLVAQLVAAGFTDPARLYVQSFEPASLVELHDVWMPRAGVAWPLVQLLGPLHAGAPWDVAWHRARGDDLGALYGPDMPFAAAGRTTYAALVQPAGLRWLRRYAAALGPHKDDLLAPGGQDPPAARGPGPERPVVAPSWFTEARALGFAVHPYTLRSERDGAAQARRLLELGVQGWFTDQPDVGVAVRDAFVAGRGR